MKRLLWLALLLPSLTLWGPRSLGQGPPTPPPPSPTAPAPVVGQAEAGDQQGERGTPALPWAMAVLCTLGIMTIVCMPSRKS